VNESEGISAGVTYLLESWDQMRHDRSPLISRPMSEQSTPNKTGTQRYPVSPSSVAKRVARHFTFGRSRVLTLAPPDQVWFFFRGFPTQSHRGMSHITDQANAGSVSTSQYFTIPIQNLPVSVAEKALESLSSPPPFEGE
jgi:hypothetical protein